MTTQVRPPRGGLRAPVHGAEAPLTRPERGAMRDVATFLLAGGGGQRLRPLTQETPKPALPFGPEGRIIDFSLEGCLAAGIPTVAVITQYRPAPLEAYLSTRFAPRFLARGGALALVRTGVGGAPACLGTVDAILEGLDGLDRGVETLLVLAADYVHRMDYEAFVAAHVSARADLTIGAVPVPLADATRFGVIDAEPTGHVRGFAERPAAPRAMPRDPSRAQASMGIYVLRREALAAAARRIGRRRGIDFGRDIVPAVLAECARVHVFRHAAPGTCEPGLWYDVGTPDALLAASLALHPDGAAAPSARVHPEARVRRSVLRAGVVIERGAVVDEALILDGAVIGEGAVVRRTIVGPGCRVSSGAALAPRTDADDGVVVHAEA